MTFFDDSLMSCCGNILFSTGLGQQTDKLLITRQIAQNYIIGNLNHAVTLKDNLEKEYLTDQYTIIVKYSHQSNERYHFLSDFYKNYSSFDNFKIDIETGFQDFSIKNVWILLADKYQICQTGSLLSIKIDEYCFKVGVNSISFLPNNPILKVQQYDIWKKHAPKLARALRAFQTRSKLKLFEHENSDFGIYGANFYDNPFYFYNKSIEGITFDEFHIPFELLNEDDYKWRAVYE